MGIYAEAAIWAEMNGRDPSDMSAEDYMAFYGEYDDAPKTRRKHQCQCGKKFRSNRGLTDHKRDKGCGK